MPGEQDDVRLIVEIKNKEPLELLDLTKSLISLANQFNNYAEEFGESKENREARLFVKEIKTGSVILELYEYAKAGVIPFVENVHTVVGFAGFIGKAFNFILGKSDEKPKEFTKTDYKDLAQIINPIANDSASQLNLSTKIDGNVSITFQIGSIEANAAQNLIDRYTKEVSKQEDGEETRKKVLLTFYQTRSDIKATTGNKGVIEEISKKPMNIIFEEETLNEKMLHGDFSPYETIYVVDALPQTVGGKVAAYKILNLHETFEKPGQ